MSVQLHTILHRIRFARASDEDFSTNIYADHAQLSQTLHTQRDRRYEIMKSSGSRQRFERDREMQCRIWWNIRRTAFSSVPKLRWDHELPFPSLLHSQNPTIPTLDNIASSAPRNTQPRPVVATLAAVTVILTLQPYSQSWGCYLKS